MNFDVVVSAPGCDCNQQPFDDASLATVSAAVDSSTSHTFTLPAPSANAYDANPAMRACQVASTTCATSGSFGTVTLADDSALPAWITFDGTDALTIAPTDGALQASNPYSIKLVWTPTNGGNNPTYTALDITVTCEVTSFTVSGAPSA